MKDKDLEKTLNRYKGKEVLILDSFGYLYNAIVPKEIKKSKRGYKMEEYDHRHDAWYNGYIKAEDVEKIKPYTYEKRKIMDIMRWLKE